MLLRLLTKPADVGGTEFCTFPCETVAKLFVGAYVPATLPAFRVPDKPNCIHRPRRVTSEGKRRKWQNTNAPGRLGARRNRFLRMFRTEPRSRRRLVPRQAHRCCKPLRTYQGGHIDRGDRASHTSGQERHERVHYNPTCLLRPRRDSKWNRDMVGKTINNSLNFCARFSFLFCKLSNIANISVGVVN